MSNKNQAKVAIITGGSRGIGRAICVELARDGLYIIINFRSDDQGAAETLKMVRDNGGDGEIAGFDVSSSADVKNAIDAITGRFDNIEVLVNNAGITADGLFMFMTEDEWDSVINTSLKGFYNVTRPILKRWWGEKKGSIVSISSLSALVGHRGQANYSAAKAGLIGTSRAIATEVARIGIRVNVVAPGLIRNRDDQGCSQGFHKGGDSHGKSGETGGSGEGCQVSLL